MPIVEYLLDHRADINDYSYQTPLHTAIGKHLEAVEHDLGRGATCISKIMNEELLLHDLKVSFLLVIKLNAIITGGRVAVSLEAHHLVIRNCKN